jgi:hypothetical protein
LRGRFVLLKIVESPILKITMAGDQEELEDLICRSDQLLIEYLECTENFMRGALDEEKLLKEGFINIAHARMCMKPNLISLDGFPNESTEEFSAASVTTTNTAESEDETDEGEESRKLETDSSRNLELRRLFGRSTPGSLKHAQIIFQRVLARAVERANILRELRGIEKKRKDLGEKMKSVVKAHEENVAGIEALSVSR